MPTEGEAAQQPIVLNMSVQLNFHTDWWMNICLSVLIWPGMYVTFLK
jgi:hypothetical protein